MDIQAEKISLIQWLANLNDAETLQELISFRESKESDWWDELSSEERSEIKTGIDQANNGDFVSHQDVISKYKKWL
jgi:predicted transcriptional regulator